MKHKKSIYFLLPLVIFIWGSVMYEFFSFSNDQEIEQKNGSQDDDFSLEFKKREITRINVMYRDPFLGKVYRESNARIVSSKKAVVPKGKQPKIEETIVWPALQYKGIVSDTKEKNKVFMLIINGKTFLMKAGETENEVYLKSGDRTSVLVNYKGKPDLIFLEE